MEQAHQVPAHVSLRGSVPHRPSPGISLPFHLVSDSSCLALGTSLHLGVQGAGCRSCSWCNVQGGAGMQWLLGISHGPSVPHSFAQSCFLQSPTSFVRAMCHHWAAWGGGGRLCVWLF